MILLPLILAAATVGQPPPTPPCDLACEQRTSSSLLEQGEVRPAVERLRAALARFPADPELTLLLARAYLLDGNLFWAERTLRGALAVRPDDAAARAWLACVHLRQGDPDLVAGDLDPAFLPATGGARSRWSLLEAYRARLAGDAERAGRALAEVPRSAEVYPEDRPVWRILNRRHDPWWLDSLAGDLELSAGATSNALAGAPTDPGVAGSGSALADFEARARLAPPVAGDLRPVLDVELLGHGLNDEAYRELSSLQGAARLGGLLNRPGYRLLLGYRPELLLLNQDPSRYAWANRGELELERSSGLLLFAGGGRRTYRDDRRTRWEGDAGLGGPLRLFTRLSLVGGATVRLADASSPAYDQRGISVAVAGRVGLGRGFAARLAATASWDDYPHSGGAAGLEVFGNEAPRRDLLGRLTVGVLAPERRGVRAAIEWQLSRRDSTVDDPPGLNFDYHESRLVAQVRWRFSSDPWAPRAVAPPGHVPLDWGLGDGTGDDDEQIIELLRQDEELRRGSSCAVR
jgi:tetratricopeptide (TPR) repeat protein